MILEVWTNGLTHSDRRIYFIDITGVDHQLVGWSFRMFQSARPEAKNLGSANTIVWTGETTTLLGVLDDVDHVFVPEFDNEEEHPGTTKKFLWLLEELKNHPGPKETR